MQEFTAPLGHVLYILIPTTHLNHGKLSHAFIIHGSLTTHLNHGKLSHAFIIHGSLTTHLNHGKLSHAFTIHGSLYYIYVHAPLMRHRCKSQGGASS